MGSGGLAVDEIRGGHGGGGNLGVLLRHGAREAGHRGRGDGHGFTGPHLDGAPLRRALVVELESLGGKSNGVPRHPLANGERTGITVIILRQSNSLFLSCDGDFLLVELAVFYIARSVAAQVGEFALGAGGNVLDAGRVPILQFRLAGETTAGVAHLNARIGVGRFAVNLEFLGNADAAGGTHIIIREGDIDGFPADDHLGLGFNVDLVQGVAGELLIWNRQGADRTER